MGRMAIKETTITAMAGTGAAASGTGGRFNDAAARTGAGSPGAPATDGTHARGAVGRTAPTLRVAAAQFEVGPDPDANLATVRGFAGRAAAQGVRLLVLPEGLIARDGNDEAFAAAHAQPLDGPFATGLRRIAERAGIALTGTIHVPAEGGRVANLGVIIDHGDIITTYRKLHLYDAFAMRESDTVEPGGGLPPVVGIDGWHVGMMTCYDLRFPETARSLAVRGADVIAVPAAWVRGPAKERHWALMADARALENTCHVVACSEASAWHIGRSRITGPLGDALAEAPDAESGMIMADLRRADLEEARRVLPVLANRRFADPTLR